MSPPRITSLATPPAIGRWYLVPTVEYPWLGDDGARPWPVFLPKHEDAEHLNFPWGHYHVDPRFLSSRDWARCKGWSMPWGHAREGWDRDGHAFTQRTPLNKRAPAGSGVEIVPHPKVVWRRMRCARVEIPYQHHDKNGIQSIASAHEGRTCKRARSGWVCPHRPVPLGSIAPDAQGVITCPLHGLRIRATDGVVLPLQS